MVRKWSLLIVLLLLPLTAVRAQDIQLTQQYTFTSSAVIHFPADWNLTVQGIRLITLTSQATRLDVTEGLAAGSPALSKEDALKDALERYVDVHYKDEDFAASAVKSLQLSQREGATYTHMLSSGAQGTLIALPFSDGALGLLDEVSLNKGQLTEADIVLAIADSFDRGSSSSDLPAAVSDCTVSTSSAGTVEVRVGPGTNRTPIAFLPAGQNFKVLGKAEANDHTLWWKLDREEVAPKKSAAEAWVAQDAVETTGDCAAVADVNAPPIIPIVAAAPPASSSSGDTTQAATTGAILPKSGTWRTDLGPNMPVSCLDNPGLTVTVTGKNQSFVDDIQNVSATSITISGVVYPAIQPGVYQAKAAFLTGEYGTWTFRVISDTVMTTEFNYSLSYQGVMCSGTLSGTSVWVG